MFPPFAADTLHYGIRCDETEVLSISATPHPETATVQVSGGGGGIETRGEVLGEEIFLKHDEALGVSVRDGDRARSYVIHCIPHSFPMVRVAAESRPEAEGFLVADFRYRTPDGEVSYIAILDDNGVPRFHRRIEGNAMNFRWHPAQRKYSYARRFERITCGFEIVLLDEDLREMERVESFGGECTPDGHDFLFTEDGNYLLMAYLPSVEEGETVHHSVIREVSPSGEVRFDWNSRDGAGGGHPVLKESDCAGHTHSNRAFLNSFFLSKSEEDGDEDLLASFRGCGQVLKIDRASGRVLWQLGGTAPAIADGRIHYRITGDPVPTGFGGQHNPVETGSGTIVLFDNGLRFEDERPRHLHPSRVVEYRLGGAEASFRRHYQSLWGSRYAGSVQILDNGHWFISWGFGPARGRDAAITEVDPATGRVVFSLKFFREESPVRIYRAYREYGLELPPKTGAGSPE